MTARDAILNAAAAVESTLQSLPDYSDFGIVYDDSVSQFCEVLELVGGSAQRVSEAGLSEAVQRHCRELGAQTIVSFREEVLPGNVAYQTFESGHAFEDVDLCLLEGTIGVAENAAVWVRIPESCDRSVLFLSQHVVLILRADAIVANLHRAYEKIAERPFHFGVFVSGPSKTADIEQSLVIGAHGPRTLFALVIE